MLTHYGLLGVRQDAAVEVIRSAYRMRVRMSHPDRVPAADRDAASELTSAINEAYRVLSDPLLRSEYDRTLTSSVSSHTDSNDTRNSTENPTSHTAPQSDPRQGSRWGTTRPEPKTVTLRDLVTERIVTALQTGLQCAQDADPELAQALLNRSLARADGSSELMRFCLGQAEAVDVVAAESLGQAMLTMLQDLKGDKDVREKILALSALAEASQNHIVGDLRTGLADRLTPWRYKGHGFPSSGLKYRALTLTSRLTRRD